MRNSSPSSKDNTINNENDLRIIELAEEIERLSIELNRRISIASEEILTTATPIDTTTTTQITSTASVPEVTTHRFQLGDLVEITNNYKGNYGRRGKITKITKSQVAIKFPDSPSRIYKKKTNVRFISRDE
jgi:hypothetical protein